MLFDKSRKDAIISAFNEFLEETQKGRLVGKHNNRLYMVIFQDEESIPEDIEHYQHYEESVPEDIEHLQYLIGHLKMPRTKIEQEKFNDLLVEYVRLVSPSAYLAPIKFLKPFLKEKFYELFLNAVAENYNDPIQFLIQKIEFEKRRLNFNLGHFSYETVVKVKSDSKPGKIMSKFIPDFTSDKTEDVKIEADIYLYAERGEGAGSEAPNVIKAKAYCTNAYTLESPSIKVGSDWDVFEFPSVKVGIDAGNVAHIYAIQNYATEQSGLFVELMQEKFKSLKAPRHNPKTEYPLTDLITASFTATLTMTLSYLHSIGVRKVVFSPVLLNRLLEKYRSAEIIAKENAIKDGKDPSSSEDVINMANEKIDEIADNLITKFFATVIRVVDAIDGMDIISYPDGDVTSLIITMDDELSAKDGAFEAFMPNEWTKEETVRGR